MNKKLLVTAVAGTLVAPAVLAQDPEVKLYGRINQALEYKDVDGSDRDQADIFNVNSRLGIKASTDLGNGITVRGHYEFSTFTDIEGERNAANIAADGGSVKTRGGINDTRIATAGIAGPFGAIDVGNQWSAFFNHVGTYMDPTFTVGYVIYSSVSRMPYRASNTIKYSNGFGPVNLELDLRISDETEPPFDVEVLGRDRGEDFLDGFGLGLSWNVIDTLTLAAAFDTDIADEPLDDINRAGIAGSFNFLDMHTVAVAWTGYVNDVETLTGSGDFFSDDRDNFTIQYTGNFGIGRVFLGWAVANVDATDVDPNQVMWGFYRKLGGGFQWWYEGTYVDFDEPGTDVGDFSRNLIGMRYDF